MSATIHANSLEAYHDGEMGAFTKRESEILSAFDRLGVLTDRECLSALNYPDMNAVRPRITELIQKGVLSEVGETKCPVTEKTVRLCKIAPLDNGDYLPGFNAGGIAMTDKQIKRRETRK